MPADWILLGLVGLSVVVGFWRGFIKEVLALAIWVAAVAVAFYFSGALAEGLTDFVELPSARVALAFAGLFFIALALGGLLTWIMGQLVEKTGLSGTDRLLGGVFGLARGVVLVVALIVVAGFTPVPADPWWAKSQVIQSALPLAEWAAGFLPEAAREYFELHPNGRQGGDRRPELAGPATEDAAMRARIAAAKALSHPAETGPGLCVES